MPSRCVVCDGPFQIRGEPLFCEFCPDVTEDEFADLPLAERPASEREDALVRRL